MTLPTTSGSRCRCHSGLLYLSLTDCPACGHSSLDRVGDWEGCERRACGYQKIGVGSADRKSAPRRANDRGHGNEGMSFDAR